MNITVPLLDDLPEDDEYGQDRIRPAIYLASRMLADATPPAMLGDIKRKRSIVVIVELPSPDWHDLIRRIVQTQLRPADFIFKGELPSKKSINTQTQDHSLRAAIEVGHSLVAIVNDADLQLSPAVVASSDYRIRIPHPTNAQVAATLRAAYGVARIGKVPPEIGKVPASALLAALRPQENAGRAVARLHKLDRRLSSGHGAMLTFPSGPSLTDLSGYGAAKDWGLALAQDIQAYRRGELAWAELSSAALLHGAPGVGKTFFAAALARSCQVPFVSTSLGQLFTSTDGYLHSILKGMDQAFQEARAKAPSLLFIDEIDALPNRAHIAERHQDYWATVITHFLKLLDDSRNGVVILAATNIASRLDAALTRAGRIELHFEITPPSSEELVGVFRHHLGSRLPEAQLASLAELAQGATGADVAFRTKTALAEARRAGRELDYNDVASQFLQDDVEGEDLRRIAIHEAGHAVVAMALGRHVDHASTVSIGSRGGGILVDGIGPIGTRQRLEDQVVIALAGRAAEILLLGEGSSGSHNDLEAATAFVCSIHGSLGLGATVHQRAPVAETTRALSDASFRDLVEAEMRILDARCHVTLTRHLAQLEAVASALVERRALTGVELRKLFRDA